MLGVSTRAGSYYPAEAVFIEWATLDVGLESQSPSLHHVSIMLFALVDLVRVNRVRKVC